MISYIYQQSAQVLIWLDTPEDETDAAMAIGKSKRLAIVATMPNKLDYHLKA
jgi:hypothetical protein